MSPHKLRLLADCLELGFMTMEDRKGWVSDLRGLAICVERYEPPKPKRQIGIAAINKKTGRAASGAYYTAGAKLYKSEPLARAALKHHIEMRGDEFDFLPAFVEVQA